METNEELYIKGFNHGYLMAKHEPEALKQLLKATPENEYLQGMQGGQKEYEKELAKEMLHQKMQHSKDKSKDQDK
jgi:hypothetical protein